MDPSDSRKATVEAKAEGTATITVTSNNISKTCTVTVPEDKVTGLSMETTAKLYLKHALGQRSGVSRLHDAVSEYQSLRHDQ